jgi:hypothetical protein
MFGIVSQREGCRQLRQEVPAEQGEGTRVEVYLHLGSGTGATVLEAQKAAARAALAALS